MSKSALSKSLDIGLRGPSMSESNLSSRDAEPDLGQRSRYILSGAGAGSRWNILLAAGAGSRKVFLDGAEAGDVPNLHDFASPEPEPEPPAPVHFARSRNRSHWNILLEAGAGAGIVFRSRSRPKFARLCIPAFYRVLETALYNSNMAPLRS